MLEAIKFVRGAVAKKDFVPELTHFLIKGRRITGYNGVIALSAPLDIDVEAMPKAGRFWLALQKCEEEPRIKMTDNGRLSIVSGKFRSFIECIDGQEAMAPAAPEGEQIDLGPGFMEAITAVAPFQSTDASRPWAMGILLKGASVMATNNVVFVEYWHGHHMPFSMIIPTVAVNELLRINEEPLAVVSDGSSLTFHFTHGRWLKTQLVAAEWPEKAMDLLDQHSFEFSPNVPELFHALDQIKPFLDKSQYVFFTDIGIGTTRELSLGTHYEVEGIPPDQCYAYQVLDLLREAEQIDFTPFPKPCGFRAPKMRGMFLGLKI